MLKNKLLKIGSEKICPAAVIIRDSSILLGLRNYTPDKWKAISVWTTPGGRCDANETIEDALRREVKEEVGINKLEIIDFIGEVSGVKTGDTVPIFFCKTNQEARLLEPEKFSEWRWVLISEYKQEGQYSAMNPGAHKLIIEFLKN